jgi:hypothetical protein
MKRYEVTFHFDSCGPIPVLVEADDVVSAEAAARCKEVGNPVPDIIRASVVEVKHGGARHGSGNKQRRKLVKESRSVKKQIRWTKNEWSQVEEQAKKAGMRVSAYQRLKILG